MLALIPLPISKLFSDFPLKRFHSLTGSKTHLLLKEKYLVLEEKCLVSQGKGSCLKRGYSMNCGKAPEYK